mmetsp:Transcript_11152/g.34164  ORF Transcript_11152/g.34164 Transcript_11152/m.34164 type:complete len:88 (-) Transcript_11152:24-287(-)
MGLWPLPQFVPWAPKVVRYVQSAENGGKCFKSSQHSKSTYSGRSEVVNLPVEDCVKPDSSAHDGCIYVRSPSPTPALQPEVILERIN